MQPDVGVHERPGWIMALFRSGFSIGNFETSYAAFRLRTVKDLIEDRIPQEPGSREALRQAALEELDNPNHLIVERALFFLLVVGHAIDAKAVKPLKHSPNEVIQKAAKTCLFELRQGES